jgi:hypothetical protein
MLLSISATAVKTHPMLKSRLHAYVFLAKNMHIFDSVLMKTWYIGYQLDR